MSQYIMYKCDWCDFEDNDPAFLVEEDDDGQGLCSDCSKEARAATEAARQGAERGEAD